MAGEKDSKLQQISASVAALVATVPPLLQGDKVDAAIRLAGVGVASVMENIRARTKKLDQEVRDALADERLNARFDETVKPDEFLALYVRSRDTAAKSEKEQKLRYIRNFLIHSLTLPTSAEPDKERYLRLIDELSFREHEYFIGFLEMIVPSGGSPTIQQWLVKPTRTGGMISTFARQQLGLPQGTSSAAVNDLTDEMVVAFRHLHGAGLLDGYATRGGGDMFQFDTNGFTPRFLRFVVDPF
jgi:hypothetical protein